MFNVKQSFDVAATRNAPKYSDTRQRRIEERGTMRNKFINLWTKHTFCLREITYVQRFFGVIYLSTALPLFIYSHCNIFRKRFNNLFFLIFLVQLFNLKKKQIESKLGIKFALI